MKDRQARRDGRPTSRRAATTLLVAAAFVGVAATCVRREPQPHVVVIRSFTYQPDTLTVAQGDTVVWTNEDVVPHTATTRDDVWDSGSLSTGESRRFVASRPGSHEYYCVFHPNMQGVVHVR